MPVEPPVRALEAICRRPEAPQRMASDLGRYLEQLGVSGPDLEVLRSVGSQRLLVYRTLVHNRLRHAIRDFVPRTIARLGEARFREDFTAFMAGPGPKSPYLREVPREFVLWCAERWHGDAVPSYLLDLARHELCDLETRNRPSATQASGLALALDKGLLFHGSATLNRYDHAIHRLSLDVDDRSAPQAVPTSLLVYRDPSYKVRYLELTPFAHALIHALMVRSLTVEAAIPKAASSAGETVDDELLVKATYLLADLAERGVTLGARPT